MRTVITDTAAGMRWLWRARFIRTVVLTGAALTFFTMAWEATLVLLARGPMGVSETGYGIMRAVGAVGGVAGSLVTPALVRRFDRRALQITAIAATAALDLASRPSRTRPWPPWPVSTNRYAGSTDRMLSRARSRSGAGRHAIPGCRRSASARDGRGR
ncbi:MFS transporter [Streptomyces sp. NPDC002845]